MNPATPARSPSEKALLEIGDPRHVTGDGLDYWTVNLFTAGGQKHFAEVTGYSQLEAEYNARLIRNAIAAYPV